MIYLASPYSHPDADVRQARHDLAVEAAIAIMQDIGEAVFSPIAHSHYMHEWSNGTIGGNWEQTVGLIGNPYRASRGIRVNTRILWVTSERADRE